MSRKKYTLLISLSILFLLLGFASLITAAILQEKGYDSTTCTIFGVMFFPFCVLSLVILFSNIKGAMAYEANRKAEKVDKSGYLQIDNIWESKIIKACEKKKFKFIENEYYHKFKLSASKDYINYYIKVCDYRVLNDTVSNELQKYDEKNFKRNNRCFILILQTDFVNVDDLNKLIELNKESIVSEGFIRSPRTNNVVYALLDRANYTLYYVPSNDLITIYRMGVKMLKKLTKKEK